MNRLVFLAAVVASLAGCYTPPPKYTAPISGSTAKLTFIRAGDLPFFSVTVGAGKSCENTRRVGIIGNKPDSPNVSDQPISITVPADQEIFVQLDYEESPTIGAPVCRMRRSFTPESDQSYKVLLLSLQGDCRVSITNEKIDEAAVKADPTVRFRSLGMELPVCMNIIDDSTE